MIHRITEIVKLLFQRVSVERILTDKKSRKLYYDDFNLEYLQDLMLTYCQEFSDTEMNLQIMEIQTQMNEINKNMVYQYAENKFNVFSVLFYCVPNILIFHENRVVCQYKQLLEWNKLVKAIGEDVPVLSMIAIRDIEQGIENRNFSWSPVIGHNNKQLERILNKGIADNHFHLRGSSPYFDISWMNLMNSPTKRSYQKDIEKIEKDYRDKNKKAEIQIPKQPARILIAQASLIRLYLCSRIENLQIKFSEYIISSEIIWEQIYILLLNHEYYKNMVTSICKYVKSLSRDDNSFLIYELLQAIKADETCNCYFPYLLQFLRLFENISVSITNTSPDYSDLLQSMFKQLFVKRPKIKLDDCRNCLPEHIFYNFWKQESWNTVEKLLDDPFQMEIHMVNIQIILDSMTSKTGNIDYMLQFAPDEWYSTEEAYRILAGERWFLYKILRGVLSDDQSFTREEYNLFYAYLRIKNEIRSELIQTNSIVGFENFQIYQSRKDWFSHTENYRESEAILAKLAVRDVLNNPAVRFLEVRISPGKTAEENVDNIRGYDMAIIQAYDKDEKFRNVIEEILDNKQNTRMRNFSKNDLRKRFYYVFHFAKKTEMLDEKYDLLECRHYQYRQMLKKNAEEIMEFRRAYPQYGRRVVGIDACAMEIGCRPEVFAWVFRVLKHYTNSSPDFLDNSTLPQLKVTYHVGEDFLDIVDGLRAIDEAIRFLNLNCGDRLGHALALGVDVRKWYSVKTKRITIALQDHLDNVVWMHHALIKYNIKHMSSLKGWLEEQFSHYFTYIYQESIMEMTDKSGSKISQGNFDINTYYLSGLLRGDKPEIYKFGNLRYPYEDIDLWERYAVNKRNRRSDDIRNIPEVVSLYHMYHYNKDVRKRGNEKKTISITDNYITGALMIQKAMQNEIVKRGIAIETNPSSNLNIGAFENYSEHPIKTFYNLGLTKNEQELLECPQINVSINTDDKGVFSTRIENEYALLACALENEMSLDGTYKYKREFIYEWLDKIREMGIRQVFVNDMSFNDISE